MNPEQQDERAMLSNQDDAGPSGASDAVAGAGPQGMEGEAPAPAGGTPPRPGTTDVQAYIGRQLRAVYDDVVKQPIPDRFLALMKQLEDGSREP